MSFHLLAYTASVPTGTAFTELPPIKDAEISTSVTPRFWSSSEARIFAAYLGGAGSVSVTRGRVYTPWKLPNEVRPISTTLLPPSPPTLATWLDHPMVVPPASEIIFDAAQTSGSSQTMVGLTWLTNTGLDQVPPGEVLTIRGDTTAPATALAWSEVTVTWEYYLPPGKYAIIGSEFYSASAIAHRWILEGANSRPGGLSITSISNISPAYGFNGALGKWGEFSAPLMPRLEVLCNATNDPTLTAFLQVVALS